MWSLKSPSADGHGRIHKPDLNLRNAAISSLILGLLFSVIIGVGELRAFWTPPNIVLMNSDISHSGCYPPPDQIYLSFGLRNSGNASGYAHIALFVDGSNSWSRTYSVNAMSAMHVEETVPLDCTASVHDHPKAFDLRLLWTAQTVFFLRV